MKHRLPASQQIILEAIKLEMSSGKPFKETVRVVMKSKQLNHMTVKRVSEKLDANPEIVED